MFASKFSSLFAALWLVSIIPSVLCTCYRPNGTSSDEVQPCPENIGVKTCCALGHGNPPGSDKSKGPTNDECLPNGLCENNVLVNGKPERSWWRNFCTDSEFGANNCLQACINVEQSFQQGFSRMTPCDGTRNSEKWCCGSTTYCCQPDDNPLQVRLAVVFNGSLPTQSASLSSNSTSATSMVVSSPSTSTTQSASATPPKNEDKEGLSTGAKAGIGVGAAFSVIALLGLGIFITRYLRRNKTDQIASPEESIQHPTSKPMSKELDGYEAHHEMYAGEMGHQMP